MREHKLLRADLVFYEKIEINPPKKRRDCGISHWGTTICLFPPILSVCYLINWTRCEKQTRFIFSTVLLSFSSLDINRISAALEMSSSTKECFSGQKIDVSFWISVLKGKKRVKLWAPDCCANIAARCFQRGSRSWPLKMEVKNSSLLENPLLRGV